MQPEKTEAWALRGTTHDPVQLNEPIGKKLRKELPRQLLRYIVKNIKQSIW